MSIFSKLFIADPNASDPAIAAAAGITRDHNGILQQQHTPESDQLAHNLGAIALGVAAGQGATSPSQRNRSIVAPKAPVTTKKYMQPSYERLLALQKVYGGNLIKQKDGTYFLKNKNGSFFGNGRALNAKTGKMQNYDLYGTGRFINNTPKSQLTTNALSNKNYSSGKKQIRLTHKNNFKDAWTNARNSGLATFTWNGNLYNTMKKGETQQQYNTYLANFAKKPTQNFVGDLKPSDLGSLATINPQSFNTNIEL